MGALQLIDDVIVESNVIKVYASNRFRRCYLREDFFVEYDPDVQVDSLDYSIVTIPFVLNVIPIVWLSGREYFIESLDATLAASLEEIRKTYQVMYPKIEWTGRLIPNKVVRNDSLRCGAGGVEADKPIAVFFSGGVDSTFTSLRHSEESQLLITVWGLNVDLDNESGWVQAKEHCAEFARQHGQSHTVIKTNCYPFLNRIRLDPKSPGYPHWWADFQQGLCMPSLAAPLLANKGCEKLLIAATLWQGAEAAWGSLPSIDEKVAWDGVSVHHDGYEYSRQDKIRFLKAYRQRHSVKKPTLCICNDPPQGTVANCCECEKCLASIVGLLLEGEDTAQYGFDRSIAEVTQSIQEKVANHGLAVTRRDLWFTWQDIQKRAGEIMSQSSSHIVNGVELAPFLSWLTSWDMSEYSAQCEKNRLRYHKVHDLRRSLELCLITWFPRVYRAARGVKKILCRRR